PFERYMKKLKGYVRNKAKPEGSIAEGYVAEEALTFSSYYFRDVTMKFNRLDRNVDPLPQRVSFRCSDRPEIDTYRSQFKSLFPNKDMQEEFPYWFGSQTMTKTQSRDERRTTQNSGICSPGPDGEMYYGQLQEILEFKYLLFKVALFRVKRFDTSNKGRKVNKLVLRNNMTQIDCGREAFKDEQYILVTQVKQVFYLKGKTKPHWKVVKHVNHKKFFDGGVIVVEADPDIIHFDNSSDLPLSTSLNDLDNATLHIDVQSTVVDAPPDIIDVPDEDDDIIDDENALPHDLAYSDAEDLINIVVRDVARSQGGDGGGCNDDRPPSHACTNVLWGCFANKAKTLFDLRPTWIPPDGDRVSAKGFNMHLLKYYIPQASFKAKFWKADPYHRVLRLEADQCGHVRGDYSGLSGISTIKFWNDPTEPCSRR
ncbi:hypothetical protein Tco_0839120, partial [Tanacetum coccineum]